MPTIYGTGELYGAGTSIYGRLDPVIAAAVASATRETGLQVVVTDTNLNEWSYFTGTEFDPAIYAGADGNSTLQAYRSYRGASHTIKLSGGNIIRARIGNGTLSDRQIYVQTITSPTTASQWTSWTLLYSGSHYAVWLIPTGASTYDVVHSKSDGVYINNVKKSNLTGVITLRSSLPVSGDNDDLFAIQVIEDPIDGAGKYRDLKLWGCTSRSGLTAGTPDSGNEFYSSALNYRWYRMGLAPVYDTVHIQDGLGGILALPLYTDPRSRNTGDTLVVTDFDKKVTAFQKGPLTIRGLGAGGVHNTIAGATLYYDSTNGFYYLFYNEYHSDVDMESNITPGISVVWQRSKDLYHWSEPVFTGFKSSISGIVDSSGYVWFAGWEAVYRRPSTMITYDISNYIPSLSLSIPRDNQVGTGNFLVANPAGVNDPIMALSDKPISIKLGIKGTDGNFQYFTLDEWWITKTTRQIEGASNHIQVDFGNLWARLDNPLRDTFNFIGRTIWHDWCDGGKNQSFNYYFVSGAKPAFRLNSMTVRGICLWTGWKGHSGYAKVHFSARDGQEGVIFRYIDSKNYYKAEFNSSSVMKLYMVKAGVTTELASLSSCSHNTIIVNFFWNTVQFGDDPSHLGTYTLTDAQILGKPGYVGFKSVGGYTIDDFYCNDFEYDIKTADLVKVALAMGDFHDVSVDYASSSRQMDIVWGPQTDMPTIAESLARALEIEKLELVWRDGVVQVGKFTDTGAIKTLQNEIIQTDYQDEATRRINLALVDGNDDTWIEVDSVDANLRDRQINAYFDVPELVDPDAVTARAQEEIRRGKTGRSPGGETIYQPDLWRMDVINWVDNAGTAVLVRLEGYELEVNQGVEPTQKQTWDTSLVNT